MTPAQRELHAKIQWLRPYTRAAASFSMFTQGWLPAVIRNLPLKLIKHIIAGYQRKVGSGCSGCG